MKRMAWMVLMVAMLGLGSGCANLILSSRSNITVTQGENNKGGKLDATQKFDGGGTVDLKPGGLQQLEAE